MPSALPTWNLLCYIHLLSFQLLLRIIASHHMQNLRIEHLCLPTPDRSNVYPVPGQLCRADGQHQCNKLHVQSRVHGARRRLVHSLRRRKVQARDWGRSVPGLQRRLLREWGSAIRGVRDLLRRHLLAHRISILHGVPGQLGLAGHEHKRDKLHVQQVMVGLSGWMHPM